VSTSEAGAPAAALTGGTTTVRVGSAAAAVTVSLHMPIDPPVMRDSVVADDGGAKV